MVPLIQPAGASLRPLTLSIVTVSIDIPGHPPRRPAFPTPACLVEPHSRPHRAASQRFRPAVTWSFTSAAGERDRQAGVPRFTGRRPLSDDGD